MWTISSAGVGLPGIPITVSSEGQRMFNVREKLRKLTSVVCVPHSQQLHASSIVRNNSLEAYYRNLMLGFFVAMFHVYEGTFDDKPDGRILCWHWAPTSFRVASILLDLPVASSCSPSVVIRYLAGVTIIIVTEKNCCCSAFRSIFVIFFRKVLRCFMLFVL